MGGSQGSAWVARRVTAFAKRRTPYAFLIGVFRVPQAGRRRRYNNGHEKANRENERDDCAGRCGRTEAEDLFQIGSIGLLKAIDKFVLGYDVKFSTYAVPMITGEIKRFLRDDGMLKVSRSLKEIAYKAYQAKEALTEKLGREPLLEEIAEETGVEKEELVMAMEAAGEVESLHRPVGMKDGNEVMLLEKIADTGGAEEKILDHLLLTELIK